MAVSELMEGIKTRQVLDTLLDTFCGANDAINVGFAGGFGVESLIIRWCDGPLTPVTRVRTPLGLPTII